MSGGWARRGRPRPRKKSLKVEVLTYKCFYLCRILNEAILPKNVIFNYMTKTKESVTSYKDYSHLHLRFDNFFTLRFFFGGGGLIVFQTE